VGGGGVGGGAAAVAVGSPLVVGGGLRYSGAAGCDGDEEQGGESHGGLFVRKWSQSARCGRARGAGLPVAISPGHQNASPNGAVASVGLANPPREGPMSPATWFVIASLPRCLESASWACCHAAQPPDSLTD
jgi:hypothetical protein